MSEPGGDEELLGGGSRGRLVTIGVVLSAVLVLVAVLVVRAANSDDAARTHASPTPSVPTDSASRTRPSPTPTATPTVVSVPGRVTGPLALDPRYGRALDVAVAGSDVWVLQERAISRLTAGTMRTSTPIAGLHASGKHTTTRLVLDDTDDRLWVVVGRPGRTEVREFIEAALIQSASLSWPARAVDATQLAGELFVTTSGGLIAVPFGSGKALLVGRNIHGDIAADPANNRVLVIDTDQVRIWSIRLDRAVSGSSLPIELRTGRIAVSGNGAIWIEGFAFGAAILLRLDPKTLLGAPSGRYGNETLPPAAQLIGGGDGSIYVDTGDKQRALLCIDAQLGQPTERWPLAARRAISTSQTAVAIAGSKAVVLELRNPCGG